MDLLVTTTCQDYRLTRNNHYYFEFSLNLPRMFLSRLSTVIQPLICQHRKYEFLQYSSTVFIKQLEKNTAKCIHYWNFMQFYSLCSSKFCLESKNTTCMLAYKWQHMNQAKFRAILKSRRKSFNSIYQTNYARHEKHTEYNAMGVAYNQPLLTYRILFVESLISI